MWRLVFTKIFFEQMMNCWLSYVMAQPINFDTKILWCFALRYVGIERMLLQPHQTEEVMLAEVDDLQII